MFVPVDYKALVPSIQKANAARHSDHQLQQRDDRHREGRPSSARTTSCSSTRFASTCSSRWAARARSSTSTACRPRSPRRTARRGSSGRSRKRPGIEVLASQPGQYRRLVAQQVFENLMQRFPEIDAVVSANDDMAVGVVEVLAAAGRGGKTKVVGIDGITDAIQAIADGKMFATVDFSRPRSVVSRGAGGGAPPARARSCRRRSCCRCSSSTRKTSARSRARPRNGRCRRGTRLSARRPELKSACGRSPASGRRRTVRSYRGEP